MAKKGYNNKTQVYITTDDGEWADIWMSKPQQGAHPICSTPMGRIKQKVTVGQVVKCIIDLDDI